MEWNQLVWIVPPAIGGLVIGHAIGMRQARKSSKRSLQKLNQQSLELLEARSLLLEYEAEPEKHNRLQRLLHLSLTKLQQANAEIKTLRQQRDAGNKQHFVELSRMRLRAEEACETARKACEIAVNATLRVDKLTRSQKITVTTDSTKHQVVESAAVDLAQRAINNGSSDSVTALLSRDSAEVNSRDNEQKVSAVS